MTAPIGGASRTGFAPIDLAGPSVARPPATGASFGQVLADAVDDARAHERAATAAAVGFAAGDPAVGIHETVIAAEKATIALRYTVTLKNKLIDAYRELMNTPV